MSRESVIGPVLDDTEVKRLLVVTDAWSPQTNGVVTTLSTVIEHLPRGTEQAALREVHRILKPDGVLVLSTPSDSFLTTLLDPAWWLIGHRHYGAATLRRLVRESGFSIEEETTGGGCIEMAWLPLYYLLLRLRLAGHVKPRVDRWLDLEYKRRGFQTIILKCRKA